jgi:DNA-binding CsgD family transcriptional regulator
MDQLNGLSNREREVVKLLLEGKSNKLIAGSLHITENTVEFHLKNIYAKHQVSSRTELIVKLGNSVVADRDEIAENRDRLNSRTWLTSLKEALSQIRKELKMDDVLKEPAGDAANPMTFYAAILTCFKKYADFSGRASRPEFWWFMLFILLVASAFAYVSETLVSIFLIAVLLPLLAAGTRRLRDTGKSAWWQLFLMAPVGGIVLLGILWAQPATSPQNNETTPA